MSLILVMLFWYYCYEKNSKVTSRMYLGKKFFMYKSGGWHCVTQISVKEKGPARLISSLDRIGTFRLKGSGVCKIE